MITTTWSARLGEHRAAVDAALARLAADDITARIWARDHTVWKPEPTEIANRLGWLDIASRMEEAIPRLTAFAQEVQGEGIAEVLLLGMGGSSLAPDLLGRLPFGAFGMRLSVLDSTDPEAVLAHAERLDPARTLFIVATKSGSTVETLSFFKFFYNRTMEALGAEAAGRHFVAITDPDSNLEALAARYGFRATFLNDPNIGGRYSALSYFGLLPAALLGLDLNRLLAQAQAMAAACGPDVAAAKNPAARLGAVLGAMALAGRDKATFFTDPALANFGDWAEQLIAESTGKEGKGIVPVIGEPVGPPTVYGSDRLFLSLAVGDVPPPAPPGPLVHMTLGDLYDLGGQFFLWEFAVAVAGHILGINPFDQPNVEAAKALARRAVAAYARSGRLPADEPAPLTAAAFWDFAAQAEPGDYIALQAYLRPTPETDAALRDLRLRLRDRFKVATTVGYGPRFLHSTGQLHKGDRGNGLFIQFTSDPLRDVPIPDEAGAPAATMTFGLLKMAQALGDKQALEAAGRRVIRFHLGRDVVGGLRRLKGDAP